jgi:hypothetical protein
MGIKKEKGNKNINRTKTEKEERKEERWERALRSGQPVMGQLHAVAVGL